MSLLVITKLNAAKRQLEQAVHLYFNGGDPVSIHTLAWAAYDIIYHVNKHRGGSPMLVKDQLIQFIRSEKRADFERILVQHRNFFKHADRDPEAKLDFNPDITDLILFEACDKCQWLTGEKTPALMILIVWYCVNNKKLFNPQPEIARLLDTIPAEKTKMDRKEYYDMMLPCATAQVEALEKTKSPVKLKKDE